MDLLPAHKDPFRIPIKPRRSFWWYLRRVIFFGFLAGVVYTVVMLNRSCSYDNRYDDLTLTTLKNVTPIRTNEKPTLGIAFGGGGVRGFMHLGRLKHWKRQISKPMSSSARQQARLSPRFTLQDKASTKCKPVRTRWTVIKSTRSR